jgi:hypothetical protein
MILLRLHQASLDEHHFQVLARHNQRRLARDIESFEQGNDVSSQHGLPGYVERGEGLACRSVEVAKDLKPVRARGIAEIEMLSRAANVDGP